MGKGGHKGDPPDPPNNSSKGQIKGAKGKGKGKSRHKGKGQKG